MVTLFTDSKLRAVAINSSARVSEITDAALL
jgi:hypothetical protein